VSYQVGSSEQDRVNFIRPYRDWLCGGVNREENRYDQMTFNAAFPFPFLGNHDYYDSCPCLLGLLSGSPALLQKAVALFDSTVCGRAWLPPRGSFAPAPFSIYLKGRPKHSRGDHLRPAAFTTSRLDDSRCLILPAGNFHRGWPRILYYQLPSIAGIDVCFALSTPITFKQPLPGQRSGKGVAKKRLDWSGRTANIHS